MNLPPLPENNILYIESMNIVRGFTAAQMQAYAIAAIEADRARIEQKEKQMAILCVDQLELRLRDYFAAKAMDGFNKYMVDYGWGQEILVGHAKQAYALADAMLEARK